MKWLDSIFFNMGKLFDGSNEPGSAESVTALVLRAAKSRLRAASPARVLA
jgi:hypothetical protein